MSRIFKIFEISKIIGLDTRGGFSKTVPVHQSPNLGK